jgi:uncharacterized phage infection (PIP) family protein YhgE
MGKSRRIHNRRVQKKHTRKHGHTRRKNKVKKKYSRKQRGGVATAAVVPFIELGAGALALTVAVLGISSGVRYIFNRNTEYTDAELKDSLEEQRLEELIHSLSGVGENNNASDSLNVVLASITSISNLLKKEINSVNRALDELGTANKEKKDRITKYQDVILDLMNITSRATAAAEAAKKALARAQTEIPKTIQKVKELRISNLQRRISHMEKQQQDEMGEAIDKASECKAELEHLLETVNEITISDPFQSDELKEDEIWSSDVTADIIYKTNEAIESITKEIKSLGSSRDKSNSRIVIL